MITKLTLTLNQEVIDSAKAYAKRNGKSLSAIVENYLRSLDYESEMKEALARKVKRLLGSVKRLGYGDGLVQRSPCCS